MRKRALMVWLAGVLLALNVVWAREGRPNVVFILADDLGWTDLGCFGSTFYETPNLDALAGDGVRFTSAYAACQVCSPTRASIMTGKYPARLNTTDYFGGPQPDEVANRWMRHEALLPAAYLEHLPLEETTIAEALKAEGYATFFAGKWHLGPEGYWPEDQGFDVNKGGIQRGGPYGGNKYFSPYGNPRLSDGPEGEHLPDRLAAEAGKFIEAHRDEPFLVYLSFYSVHTPLMTTPALRDKYEQKAKTVRVEHGIEIIPEDRRMNRAVQRHAVYGGMVQSMDEAVGRVIDKLKALDLYANTAVIFMSDNGGLSTSEGSPTSNLPLRAGKGWMYEGGIREPMIIRWPGVTQAGTTCDEPVISTDFYPTMLEMAGAAMRPAQHMDGVSLAPLLRGEEHLDRDAIYWHYPHHGNQGGSPSGAIRAGDWKLIERFEDGRLELYNVRQDIGETRDLSEARPDVVSMLHKKLKDWRSQVDARMPARNPNAQPAAPRVLIIGDSISAGYYPPLREIMKGEAEVVRIPGNGADTWNGLANLDKWMGNGHWDVIHFNWGLHDLAWRNPQTRRGLQKDGGRLSTTLTEYERNLHMLVARLKMTDAKLIFATTTPVPEGEPGRFAGDAARYNEVARRIMTQHGIAIDDLHAHIQPRVSDLQRAGGNVHFTPEGSKFLAEQVAASIREALR